MEKLWVYHKFYNVNYKKKLEKIKKKGIKTYKEVKKRKTK